MRAIVVLVAGLVGLAAACDRAEYDDPNDVVFPVELIEVTVEDSRTVRVAVDILVPDGVTDGVEWLEIAELSIRRDGAEYLRAYYDPDRGPFGIYVDEDFTERQTSRGQPGRWGVLIEGSEEVTVVTPDGERHPLDDGAFRLTWGFTLFDLPAGEYRLFCRALPLRQQDRPFRAIGAFTLED